MSSQRRSGSRVVQLVGSVLAAGLLLYSWFICYHGVAALTEMWGAPWDLTPIRPPVGYWQRILNGFFESGLGAYVPAALFLAVSLALYMHTLLSTRAVWTTSFAYAATNFLALAALFGAGIPLETYLTRMGASLTPQDWSYWGDFRREWPLTLVALVLFAGLFLLQPRLARWLKRTMESSG